MDSCEKNSPSLTNGSGIAFFTLVYKEREDLHSENWQRDGEGSVQLDVDSVLTVSSLIIVLGFLLLVMIFSHNEAPDVWLLAHDTNNTQRQITPAA